MITRLTRVLTRQPMRSLISLF